MCKKANRKSQKLSPFAEVAGNLPNVYIVTLTQLINPCPAEPGYTLPLQTMWIQISWLLKKPTDLDLHCLSFSM